MRRKTGKRSISGLLVGGPEPTSPATTCIVLGPARIYNVRDLDELLMRFELLIEELRLSKNANRRRRMYREAEDTILQLERIVRKTQEEIAQMSVRLGEKSIHPKRVATRLDN